MVRPILISLGLIAVFVLGSLVIPADPMTEILSAGVLIAACFGLWRWMPAAWRNFISGADTETAWGLLGVVLLLIALAAQRVYAVLYVALDRPDEFTLLHISPFITYLVFIALVLFIAATKFKDERPNKVTGIVAASIAFIGVVFSAAFPIVVAKIAAIGVAMAKLGVIFIPH